MKKSREIATLAGGCFWCTEAIFQKLIGVVKVTSGYSGGWEIPNWENVYGGKTNLAESVQIEFDPQVISYQTLLDVFFHLHDPTTLNRQNYDIGPKYRSAVFYHSSEQKEIAQNLIDKLQNSGQYQDRIVTEISPYKNFYPAEDFHQNYYQRNNFQPYCQIIIKPKLKKLLEDYSSLVNN